MDGVALPDEEPFDHEAEAHPYRRDPVTELKRLGDPDVRTLPSDPKDAPVAAVAKEVDAAVGLIQVSVDALIVHIDDILGPESEVKRADPGSGPKRSKVVDQMTGWREQLTALAARIDEVNSRVEL